MLDIQKLSEKIAIRLEALRDGEDYKSLRLKIRLNTGMDISDSALKSYEKPQGEPHSQAGANLGMNVRYLCAMADYYDVTTDYILGRSESKEPEDSDVTLLIDRFGFSPKAARILTEWSIPSNGPAARRKFEALNRLIEQTEFEGVLQGLELCLRFGQTVTPFESVVDNVETKDSTDIKRIVRNKEQNRRTDRGMYRSAAIYNPQHWIRIIAERFIEKSEQQNTALEGGNG